LERGGDGFVTCSRIGHWAYSWPTREIHGQFNQRKAMKNAGSFGKALARLGAVAFALSVATASLDAQVVCGTYFGMANVNGTEARGDASAAVRVGSGYMFVANDEDNRFYLYLECAGGTPVGPVVPATPYWGWLDLTDMNPSHNFREVDVEATCRLGTSVTNIWMGSHSLNPSGVVRPNRYRVFGTVQNGSGAGTTLSYSGRHYDTLHVDIRTWDDAHASRYAIGYWQGIDPDHGGFNIEGLAFQWGSVQTAFVGLRGPLAPNGNALLFTVSNIHALVASGSTAAAIVGDPIELNLCGLGIRDIMATSSGYIIIGGDPADLVAPALESRIFTWSGIAGDRPVERAISYAGIVPLPNPEAIVADYSDPLGEFATIRVLSDDGGAGTFREISGTFGPGIGAPGALDLTFNPGTGANNNVMATAVQSDGKVLIGGSFTTVNGVSRTYIARLNTDGSVDTGFVPATLNGNVYALVVQPDGKIVIGGAFTTAGAYSRSRIARLTSVGAVDTSFNPGSGADWDVYTLALQADGSILAGGSFTVVGGVAHNYLARLNANGSVDNTYAPPMGAYVYAIAVQSDGKHVIGGDNTLVVGPSPRYYCARLNANGTVDTTFGGTPNGHVLAIAIQSDGKIVLGGAFSTIDSVSRSAIGRLTAAGALDTSFNPGTGFNSTVYALALQPIGGSILVGGYFTSYNGLVRNRMAQVTTGGALDTCFDAGLGPDSTVWSMALGPSAATLAIGGAFIQVNGTSRNHVARLYAN
jgi:uncharacterized delta-60 repeat protein